MAGHLDFVGLRRRANGQPQPRLTLQWGDVHHDLQPLEGEAPVLPWSTREATLTALAARVGLEKLETVTGAVRWPARGQVGQLYCYLPTASKTFFGIDLHGDFQLGIDRKNLDVTGSGDLACYNRTLIERGVRVHLAGVLRALGIQPEDIGWNDAPQTPAGMGCRRADLWHLLSPGGDYWYQKSESALWQAYVEPVRAVLFPKGNLKHQAHWQRWAKLAARAFPAGHAHPAVTLRDFWRTTQHWLETATRGWYKDAKTEIAPACLQALSAAGAHVVPLTPMSGIDQDIPDEPLSTFLLPTERVAAGQRTTRRLFQLLDRERLSTLRIPAPVRAQGREVTGWTFPQSFRNNSRLHGSSEFERAPLLQELRQLPSRRPATGWQLKPLHEDPQTACQQQEALLVFAAELFVLKVARGAGEESYQMLSHLPGWRARHSANATDKQRAGRALATLFVPDRHGQWIPARQAHRAHLNPHWLDRLQLAVPGLQITAFLRFLGVCVWAGGLLLVEEGTAGLVPPQEVPPALVESSRGELPALSIPLQGVGLLGRGEHSATPGEESLSGHALKEAIDAAWRASWLQGLAAAEREHRGRIDVFGMLGTARWFPAVDAEAPAGTSEPPESLIPGQLTLRERAPNRLLSVLWRILPADEQERGWLAALGARSLEERLKTVEGTISLVEELHRGLVLPSLEGRARLGVTELQQPILDRLHREPDRWPADLPMLYYKPAEAGAVGLRDRTLAWGVAEHLWVAGSPSDRESIRQLFPSVPLMCATLGPRQRKETPLEHQGLKLTSTLQPTHATPLQGGEAAARGALDPLLPALLAMAEVSRRYVHQVDPGEVRARWSRTRLHRYADIWWEWSLQNGPPNITSRPRQRGVYNDVAVHVQLKQKEFDQATIFYDVDQARPLPPLANFAPALAEVLLDKTAEPDFVSALGAYDAGGEEQLEALLQRSGCVALRNFFRRQLSPLSDDDVVVIQAQVQQVLADHCAVLRSDWDPRQRARLGPADLQLPHPDVTASALNEALEQIAWTDQQRPFAPIFGCAEENQRVWEAWLGCHNRAVRLVRAAWEAQNAGESPRSGALLQHPLATSLDKQVQESLGQVRFSPEAIATQWLQEHSALPEGGLDNLAPLVRFSPVQCPPLTGGIQPISLVPPKTVSKELAPITSRDNAQRASKGEGAEKALLAWVVSQTGLLLSRWGQAGWNALLGAVPRSGQTRTRLLQAQADTRPLEEALHISHRWGSAGFDLLGLSEEDGKIVPARYEVKALPAEHGSVRVFLSRNELAVYRAVSQREDARHARGFWKLIGVTPSGTAHDLTPLLEPIQAAHTGPLATLATKGMQPDSLEVKLELSS